MGHHSRAFPDRLANWQNRESSIYQWAQQRRRDPSKTDERDHLVEGPYPVIVILPVLHEAKHLAIVELTKDIKGVPVTSQQSSL